MYTEAESKVVAAKAVLSQKVAEASAAATAVETATQEAAKLVMECKCKTKKTLDKTLAEMNSSAKDHNTQAWNKAHHMECVLAGKTTNNCQVPALPVVVAVPYGEGVKNACGKDCSNGAGQTFTVQPGETLKDIAKAACEAHMKAKNNGHTCKQASCGHFYYYYDSTTRSCDTAKQNGLYEWVYQNNGYAQVGSDYGQGSTSVSGMNSFVRYRSGNQWHLNMAHLGQGCAQ